MDANPPTVSKFTRQSAVIVLHEQATDSLILTQRSDTLQDHPGEICFPGGRWDSEDVDLWATALRELQEELGIDESRVQLIRQLKSEQTVGGVVIQPWFAKILTIQPYRANTNEVSAVLALPMSDVKVISNYKDIMITRASMQIKTCQFTATTYFVWGATARIMKQLCNIDLA